MYAYSEDGLNGKSDEFVPKIVNFPTTMAQPVHFSSTYFLHYPITESYASWLLLHVMKFDLFININRHLKAKKKKTFGKKIHIAKLRFQFTSATITVYWAYFKLTNGVLLSPLFLSLSPSSCSNSPSVCMLF